MLGAMMTLHKLSAGDGYTYLTRQVAALDATGLTRGGELEAYYSERGESPGRWWGAGLVGLAEASGLEEGEAIQDGDVVTEAQMKALFGEGRHPQTDLITQRVVAAQTNGGGGRDPKGWGWRRLKLRIWGNRSRSMSVIRKGFIGS